MGEADVGFDLSAKQPWQGFHYHGSLQHGLQALGARWQSELGTLPWNSSLAHSTHKSVHPHSGRVHSMGWFFLVRITLTNDTTSLMWAWHKSPKTGHGLVTVRIWFMLAQAAKGLP